MIKSGRNEKLERREIKHERTRGNKRNNKKKTKKRWMKGEIKKERIKRKERVARNGMRKEQEWKETVRMEGQEKKVWR